MYILLVLLLPLLWLMHCKCLIITFMRFLLNALQWMPLETPGNRPNSLHSHSHHSPAAYISSVSAIEQCVVSMSHLLTSLNLFNALIPSADAITLDDIVSLPCHQHALSSKIENLQFKLLFDHSSLPDRARLLSVSSPNAAAWLSVLPSPGVNLHMDSLEFQVALKWWLGMDLAQGFNCSFCPSLALDPLGHHAITSKHGCDVVARHNKLRA